MTSPRAPGDDRRRGARAFSIRTIPTNDRGFEALVRAVVERTQPARPADLQTRLAPLFPRVQVHLRPLADEPLPLWYVYREGHWISPERARWWEEPGLGRIRYDHDVRIVEANDAAAEILQVPTGELVGRHYSDFVVPGAAEDAHLLTEVLRDVGELGGTLALLTADHRVVSFEHHTRVVPDGIETVLRVVDDVADTPAASVTPAAAGIRLEVQPASDRALARYARTVLDRMAEPTPPALEALVQRLYPRASVSTDPDEAGSGGAIWTLWRDGSPGRDEDREAGRWWRDPDVGRMVWDRETRVLSADDAAHAALRVQPGELVGRHLLDLVEPGRGEEARRLVELLVEAGSGTSTIRAVGGDGVVREYDFRVQREGRAFASHLRARREPGDR